MLHMQARVVANPHAPLHVEFPTPPPVTSTSAAEHRTYRHQHQHIKPSVSAECCLSRRQVLLAASTLVPVSASVLHLAPAQAAQTAAAGASTSCQLQTSSTGLKWCDLVVGDGQLPIKGAFTKMNYTAKLASTGTVFDSTYQRKQPLILKIGEREVVEAFDLAVLGGEDIPAMHEGGKRLIVAPPGPLQKQGVKSLNWVTGLLDALEESGETVSPDGSFNSDLEFEVELLAKKRSRG